MAGDMSSFCLGYLIPSGQLPHRQDVFYQRSSDHKHYLKTSPSQPGLTPASSTCRHQNVRNPRRDRTLAGPGGPGMSPKRSRPRPPREQHRWVPPEPECSQPWLTWSRSPQGRRPLLAPSALIAVEQPTCSGLVARRRPSGTCRLAASRIPACRR